MAYSEFNDPWVAVDVGWYESGRVACGDWLLIAFDGFPPVVARAWDAGYLARHHVADIGPLPIAVDLPEHLRPDYKMAWPAWVLNLSALLERGGDQWLVSE